MLKQGDIFCVRSSESIISKLINACQWFWSTDGESTYSHSGIITDDNGATIEALYNGIRRANLYERYSGCQIIIGRIVNLTPYQFQVRYQNILRYENKPYPYWRLLFHTFPPFAKFLHHLEIPVCSELTWLYVGHSQPWGITPDIVADRIRNWDLFDIVYEGKL